MTELPVKCQLLNRSELGPKGRIITVASHEGTLSDVINNIIQLIVIGKLMDIRRDLVCGTLLKGVVDPKIELAVVITMFVYHCYES